MKQEPNSRGLGIPRLKAGEQVKSRDDVERLAQAVLVNSHEVKVISNGINGLVSLASRLSY